jgi:hypothetical protein
MSTPWRCISKAECNEAGHTQLIANGWEDCNHLVQVRQARPQKPFISGNRLLLPRPRPGPGRDVAAAIYDGEALKIGYKDINISLCAACEADPLVLYARPYALP